MALQCFLKLISYAPIHIKTKNTCLAPFKSQKYTPSVSNEEVAIFQCMYFIGKCIMVGKAQNADKFSKTPQTCLPKVTRAPEVGTKEDCEGCLRQA